MSGRWINEGPSNKCWKCTFFISAPTPLIHILVLNNDPVSKINLLLYSHLFPLLEVYFTSAISSLSTNYQQRIWNPGGCKSSTVGWRLRRLVLAFLIWSKVHSFVHNNRLDLEIMLSLTVFIVIRIFWA